MLFNKQSKYNKLIVSSELFPGRHSADCTKSFKAGIEMSRLAFFMTFGLKETSNFWNSLEEISSSNRSVKSWSTFKKED